MGNKLSGKSAQRSESLEECCQIFNFTLTTPLSSTLFFKTCKVAFEGEFYVAKFISFTPEIYEAIKRAQEKNKYIERALKTSVNCLPYKAMVRDKVAVLMRPFLYISLLDRMHSNPMLLWVEKKWIIFQLLCALNLCKRNRIYHGDLKPENVMLTSWNFVQVTDFASYKPVYLAENNSTEYSFLFDISNRRICYTAPERFYRAAEETDKLDPNFDDCGEYSMDIFSAGCIFAELCLDGKPLYDFSKSNVLGKPDHEKVESLIRGILDENIREMVLSMVSPNPSDRFTAEHYISRYFPDPCYPYLMHIMQDIVSASNLTADYIITALHLKWSEIASNLGSSSKASENSDPLHSYADNMNIDDFEGRSSVGGAEWVGNPLLVLLSLFTSFLSHLVASEAKYHAFELFKLFEPHIHVSVYFERAVPYMFIFFEDPDPNVVSEAVHVVTDYLSDLPSPCGLSREVFIDFIFPAYSSLCTKGRRSLILLAVASKIGDLCQLIRRQLKAVSLPEEGQIEVVNVYETEMDMLCDSFSEMVIMLLSGTNSAYDESDTTKGRAFGTNDVIIQLLRCSIVKIYEFFGEDRFRTTLLPHIINISQKKDNWEVRSEFFRVVPKIFSFSQLYDNSSMFLSLCEYGLGDCEEFVIYSTILCLDSIFDSDHLDTGVMLALVKRITPLLVHPNTIIRRSVGFFLCKISRHFGPAFTHCCIIPYLDDILDQDANVAEDIGPLLRAIPAPVSRELINSLIKSSKNPEIFFLMLSNRISAGDHSESLDKFYDSLSPTVKRICQKMDRTDVLCCLKLKEFICGMNSHKDHFQSIPTDLSNIIRINENLIQYSSFNYMEDSDKLTMTFPIDLFGNPTEVKREKTQKSREKHFPYNYSVRLHQFFSTKREENRLNTLRSVPQAPKLRVPDRGLQGIYVNSFIHHSAPIIGLSTDYTGTFLVSADSSSKCAVWKISRMVEGSFTPMEEISFSPRGDEHCLVAHLPFDQNFVVVSKSGSLTNYDLQSGKKINITNKISSDTGNIVGLRVCGVTNSNAYTITLSSHGYLSMIDLRIPKPVFLDSLSFQYGRCTCFDVDYSSTWVAVGTGSGSCVCWDMRFRSPFRVLKPSDSIRRSVRSVLITNMEDNRVAASYDSDNSIMLWNVAHGHVSAFLKSTGDIDETRQTWKKQFISRMVNYECNQQSNLLTVGSDMRIRNWNLSNYTQSGILSMGGLESTSYGVSYRERRYPEYLEVYEKNFVENGEALPRNRMVQEYPGHRSIISDVKLVNNSEGNAFCITSSFDKVIKIWK